MRGKSARVGGRGQAQGLPLQGRLRRKTARVGRRQGQGLRLRGFDGAGGGWGDGVLSVGHVSNIGTRSARDVVGEGALRGRSPAQGRAE